MSIRYSKFRLFREYHESNFYNIYILKLYSIIYAIPKLLNKIVIFSVCLINFSIAYTLYIVFSKFNIGVYTYR